MDQLTAALADLDRADLGAIAAEFSYRSHAHLDAGSPWTRTYAAIASAALDALNAASESDAR
jgi:hypothetical protein